MKSSLLLLLPQFNLAAMAKKAYRAYGATTGFKNFRGDPMPEFNELGDKIQSAWIEAAREVAVITIDIVLKHV